MPGRGKAFRAGVAAISLCVLVLSPAPGGASAPRSGLAREYVDAARSTGVPAALLTAIGYVNTRWTMPADASPGGGRGPMQLAGSRLTAAARLTGLSRAELVRDRAANILGGAAVLRRLARSPRPASLDGWLPAVERLYGADAAGQIFGTLLHGAQTRVGATTVRLAPQHVTIPRRLAAATAGHADYPAAIWRPASPVNYTHANRPASSPILRIVIHTTEGPYWSAIHWFQNPVSHVSAHFVVRSSDGQVTQMVSEKDEAWHAGNGYYNDTSIGIEHEAHVSNCAWYTDAMYRGSARLVAYLVLKYAIPIDRAHIIGHADVPDPSNPRLRGGAGHHTDPGPCWDWTKYLALVRAYAGRTDEAIVDNRGARFAAPGWRVARRSDVYGKNFALARPSTSGAPATFRVRVPVAGSYAIYGWWPAYPNRNASVPVDVEAAAGAQRVLVDQRASARAWALLGTFDLKPGLRTLRFSRRAAGAGWITADAVKIEPVRPIATAAIDPSGAGWALTARQLSWTSDSGTTWRSIEPPGIAARWIRAVDFDGLHGRALALMPGGPGLALFTTEDGGSTWTRSTVPAPADLDAAGQMTVTFPDDASGFVSVRREARGAGAGRLLRTANGGATWKSSSLPAPGAIAFNGSDGWLSSPETDRLYVTHNGGGSWRAVNVPKRSAYRGSIAVPGLPSFVDESSAVLPVTLAGKRSAVEFATSANGGRSWSVAAVIPAKRPLTRAKALPAAVVDAGSWLAALEGGRRFVAVADGDLLAPVTPRSLPFGGSKAPVAALHFATAQAGWAQVDSLCPLYHAPRCSGTQALYSTSDGGATWRRLSPP
jgi:N-acetyl-anhydromuramyl-L-alanine amidase AmpD/photosystem II stability/assembly factor-like uncharacterized protein